MISAKMPQVTSSTPVICSGARDSSRNNSAAVATIKTKRTIQFVDWQGDTFPFVSDVVNSSPTLDSSGSRKVTSLYTEFIFPLHATFDLQAAVRRDVICYDNLPLLEGA